MLMMEKILERLNWYGIDCENLVDDIRFIFEDMRGKEGKRKNEVLEILKEERGGIKGSDIGEKLGIKGSNVASVIMELRKGGIEVLNINGLYVLGEYVNIG